MVDNLWVLLTLVLIFLAGFFAPSLLPSSLVLGLSNNIISGIMFLSLFIMIASIASENIGAMLFIGSLSFGMFFSVNSALTKEATKRSEEVEKVVVIFFTGENLAVVYKQEYPTTEIKPSKQITCGPSLSYGACLEKSTF